MHYSARWFDWTIFSVMVPKEWGWVSREYLKQAGFAAESRFRPEVNHNTESGFVCRNSTVTTTWSSTVRALYHDVTHAALLRVLDIERCAWLIVILEFENTVLGFTAISSSWLLKAREYGEFFLCGFLFLFSSVKDKNNFSVDSSEFG